MDLRRFISVQEMSLQYKECIEDSLTHSELKLYLFIYFLKTSNKQFSKPSAFPGGESLQYFYSYGSLKCRCDGYITASLI